MTDVCGRPDAPDALATDPIEYRPFRPDRRRADRDELDELDRLLDQSLLCRLPGGVLVAARAPDTLALRAEGLALALARPGEQRARGPAAHAVVGYAAAVWLHGGGAAPERIDLVIPPGSARPKRACVRVHEHRLAPGEVRVVGDLAVTTPVRTAADIARRFPAARVGPALDRLADGCGVTVVDVLDQLERMRWGRGVVRAREMVQAWAAVVASRSQARDVSPSADRGSQAHGRFAEPVVR